LYNARRSRNLLVSPVLLEDFFLIQPAARATEATALTLAELQKLSLVLPGPENGFRKVIDAAARNAHVALNIVMEVDSVAALKQLVMSGSNICTILPFGAVHQEVRERCLIARPITSVDVQALLVTATPLYRPVTKASRALLRLIQSEI